MSSIMNGLNWFFNLPAAVSMMVGIFLIALFLGRLKIMNAFKCALYVGTGVVGMNTMIGMFASAASPVLSRVIESSNFKFSMIDIGTGSLSILNYHFSYFSIFLAGTLVINLLLIAVKFTDTFNIDICNWGMYSIPAVVVYHFSGENLLFAFLTFFIVEAVTLKIADITAPKIAETFDLEGVSIPHGSVAIFAPIGFLVNSIVERIPFLSKIDISREAIEKRFSGLIDPSTLGFVIGIILGIVAKLPVADIASFAITLTAFMLLFPKCIHFFAEGTLPIVDGMREFSEKRLKRKLYIGLDAAILIGMPDVISAGLLLVPIILVLAIILPGNKFLPMADLAIAAPFLVSMCVPYCKGNIFRGVLSGVIVFTIALYVCTITAPMYTEVANALGAGYGEGVIGNSLGIGANPLYLLLYKVFGLFY